MKALISTILIMLASSISILLCFAVFKSLILAFVLYYLCLGLALPCLDLMVFRRLSPLETINYLGLKPSVPALAIGLGAGVLIFVFLNLGVSFIADYIFRENKILHSLEEWGMGGQQNVVLVIIIMLLFNGVVEEIFWRGYIHRRLEGVASRPLAIALPVFFFTVQHLVVITGLLTSRGGILIFMLGIGVGGVFWQLLREYKKSTLACAISHAFATAGYMTFFYLHVLRG